MKKLLLAITLVLCLATALVALTSCGGDECDHIWATSATTDKKANCTEDGSASIKCMLCGAKDESSVTTTPATGHNYETESYTAATCVTDGSETKVCTVCTDTTTTTLPATGAHAWGILPTVDVEATCDADGSESIKCMDCQAVKPGSTAVIPAGHAWSIIATVDTVPTCTTEGVKSIKCMRCSIKQEGTEQSIPATGHSDVPVVVTPTFFSEGLAEGKCAFCDTTVSTDLPKTEVTLNTITAENKLNNTPYQTANIGEALEDKEFYPTEDDPNGNDLYLEFSILWNSTMQTIEGKGIGWGHIAFDADVTHESDAIYKFFSWLYYREDARWCPFVGGFEFSEKVKSFVYGPQWKENSTSESNFTIIKGLDGWHRIGLQYHQNVYNNNGTLSYDVTLTLYVDGVKTNEIIVDWGAFFYSAEIVDDQIVYVSNEEVKSNYAVFYRIGNAALRTGYTENAYFPFADCILSVGDGFVMNVSPVENPEAQDFTQGDVTLSGKMYYQLKTAE